MSEAETAKLIVQRMILRPNFLNIHIVGKTDMQLTVPTKAVMMLGARPEETMIILE